MLTVYGRKSSFNVQKVMWLVGELGIAHRHMEMGGAFGGLDTPAFRALNPHGRVPVIVDDEVTVWESHTILRYLAARYGGERFWSADAATRSHWERWMDWAHTTLQSDFLTGVFWGFYRTPQPQRDMRAVEDKIRRCAAHFQLLDTLLADRAFLLGDQLTLADIPAGTHLYRYFNIDIGRPHVPNVERWYHTLAERPAYRAHVMVPFAELEGRLEY
ncbi:MAG: glutathione S-transferase [Hyphomicrobiales bacterium]|nr:glutathione S-transferase [Hyphomicrobiales bacterium]MBV9427279.1 glutathione S-transferase [Bradyrhizobiaceae bacterium]